MNLQYIKNSSDSGELITALNDKIQLQSSNPLFSPVRHKISSDANDETGIPIVFN